MGAYNYMINAIQSGYISELNEKVKDLEKKVDILKEWVDYHEEQLKSLRKNDDVYRSGQEENSIGKANDS